MARIQAILLLLLYISVNTEMHEFYRLPILFSHLVHEQERRGDESLLNLLVEHYSASTSPKEDGHDQLPFNNVDCHHCVSVLFSPISAAPLLSVPEQTTEDFVFYTTSFYANAHSSPIWQPPRNC